MAEQPQTTPLTPAEVEEEARRAGEDTAAAREWGMAIFERARKEAERRGKHS